MIDINAYERRAHCKPEPKSNRIQQRKQKLKRKQRKKKTKSNSTEKLDSTSYLHLYTHT